MAAYRDRLADLHRQIERHGSFVAHAQRFLVEAVKGPASELPDADSSKTHVAEVRP